MSSSFTLFARNVSTVKFRRNLFEISCKFPRNSQKLPRNSQKLPQEIPQKLPRVGRDSWILPKWHEAPLVPARWCYPPPPPHTANITKEWLVAHFKKRIVSNKFPIEWAPHSPDLNPPDFFLWGYLKDRVYQEKPRSLITLKRRLKRRLRP